MFWRLTVNLRNNSRRSAPPDWISAGWRLYLPQVWADDPERCKKAKVPDDVTFQTKPQIALDQIRTAKAQGIAPGVILADAGYGADGGLPCLRKPVSSITNTASGSARFSTT